MLRIRALLIPSEEWRVRVYSVFCFAIFDYTITSIFCRTFKYERNLLLRAFMIYFRSIPLGIFIFSLSFYFPIYIVLCYFTNSEMGIPRDGGVVELLLEYRKPLFDIVLGLGVASRHFEGGMSWLLPLSNRLWLALGFILYLTIVHLGTLMESIGR